MISDILRYFFQLKTWFSKINKLKFKVTIYFF